MRKFIIAEYGILKIVIQKDLQNFIDKHEKSKEEDFFIVGEMFVAEEIAKLLKK